MKFFPTFGQFVFGILVAGFAVALTSAILVNYRGVFSTSVVALLYLLIVVLSTTIGSFTAGISASVFAFLAFNYFFLPPYNTFTVAHTQDITALFVFLVVAVIISNLMGRAQTRLKQIEAREREAIHLYELSSTLTAIRDEEQIADVLARHLLDALQAEAVEVLIQSNLPDKDCQNEPCIQVRLPEKSFRKQGFQQTQTLSTNRGRMGEIHLWTIHPILLPNEMRLLQIISSQAALAVERTLLSKAENRAKILEESDRLKTAILSSVSHDLRTPLASIQAAASSLSDASAPLDPGARDDLLSLLLEETDHLNQLVGNLLNMSRIEAGALKPQRQWNAIADIINTAVERMQRQTTRHRLEIDVSDDLPLVQVDAMLIEQVFINLISNSLKYTPIGSLIFIQACVEDEAWMQITLRNQSPRIPEEHLEHIFEKFYTYPGMKQVKSTGLGLSICKGIIEAHGGHIWANNCPDGLEFCFTLPIDEEGSLLILEDEISDLEEAQDQKSLFGKGEAHEQ
jgi:two-component system sensor histidine kinase KdpD